MLKVLHFSDAHIDIAAHGRHDPDTGLPVRVLDFLKALDQIVDAAINEKVDLVLFAGDAYKDRLPAPTFQREWGSRIIRLSQAKIPTILLVGNHDLSPSFGRAHALQEYDTLQIPHVHVIDRPQKKLSEDLDGLPVQILAIPWVSRSMFLATLQNRDEESSDIFSKLEQRLEELIDNWLSEVDPALPTILTAHASIQGAMMGGERSVMLGNDVVLPPSLLRDPRLDYVAMGHIHKAQDINQGKHPPVVYPGSIERVDFGEAQDDKFFVIANIEKGQTSIEWRKLEGRRFIDRFIKLTSADKVEEQLLDELGSEDVLEGAIVRLIVEYPRDLEVMIDEPLIRRKAATAFEFHFIRRPLMDARLRLPGNQSINEMNEQDLLALYLKSIGVKSEEIDQLKTLASEIIQNVD